MTTGKMLKDIHPDEILNSMLIRTISPMLKIKDNESLRRLRIDLRRIYLMLIGETIDLKYGIVRNHFYERINK